MTKKIIFAGNSRFSKFVLEKLLEKKIHPFLIVTAPDKKMGRGLKVSSNILKKFAEENNLKTEDITTKENLHTLFLREKPDAVIVASFGIIIPKETLFLSSFINIHPSLLPLYRGSTPIQTALLDGCKNNGVSIILMNEKVDEGPIITQKKVFLEENLNYLEAEEIFAKEGGLLLSEIIFDFLEKKIEPKKQDNNLATYTKMLKKEDGKIDWNTSADEIKRKVKSFNPWPGTYSAINGKIIKILEADIQKITSAGPFGAPGKTYLGTNGTVAVSTKDDFLIIKKLQIEGKKPVSSKDFLQGNLSLIGSTLS